jgi:hypothetical protein
MGVLVNPSNVTVFAHGAVCNTVSAESSALLTHSALALIPPGAAEVPVRCHAPAASRYTETCSPAAIELPADSREEAAAVVLQEFGGLPLAPAAGRGSEEVHAARLSTYMSALLSAAIELPAAADNGDLDELAPAFQSAGDPRQEARASETHPHVHGGTPLLPVVPIGRKRGLRFCNVFFYAVVLRHFREAGAQPDRAESESRYAYRRAPNIVCD